MFRSPFSAQLVCSLKAAALFLRFAFCLLPLQGPCKAQGCVGCRQHSLSAGGLRPLASPESKDRKGLSLSLPGTHQSSVPIPEVIGTPAPGDRDLCSKRKSASLSSNSWSTTKVNKGLVRWPIHISPSLAVQTLPPSTVQHISSPD